jgi:microsomal dipeptidase-like Zn-dependent dipeptidase
MNKIFSVLVLISLTVFVCSSYLIEWAVHRTTQEVAIDVSSETQTFHESLFVADLHADSLLWKRDLLQHSSVGFVDVPRLRQGNVALQAFTVVTQVPRTILSSHVDGEDLDLITLLAMSSLWPIETWQEPFKRAFYQSNKLHELEKSSGGSLRIIKTKEDLQNFIEERKENKQITAGLLGLEGFHANHVEGIDELFEAGFRMVAPTHFFDAPMGGSAHGLQKSGMSDFGEKVIARMEALNIALDLSHASPRLIDDVLTKFPQIPIIISHTGVKGTCPGDRNLSDEHIKAIAKSGGVIGIGYMKLAVCESNLQAIIDAIVYTANLVGDDHVALGSDYDGMIRAPFDTSGLAQMTQGLLNAGLSKESVEKIMGDNVRRFFMRSLPSTNIQKMTHQEGSSINFSN